MQTPQRISQICQGYEDAALNRHLAEQDRESAAESEAQRLAAEIYGDMANAWFVDAVQSVNDDRDNVAIIFKACRGDAESQGIYTDRVMARLQSDIETGLLCGTWEAAA